MGDYVDSDVILLFWVCALVKELAVELFGYFFCSGCVDLKCTNSVRQLIWSSIHDGWETHLTFPNSVTFSKHSLVPRPSSLCPQKKIREKKAWYNLSRD